jgi:hypothetical protein
MAKVITLQIIVRDNDEQRIEEGLKDMLTAAQSPVDPDYADAQPWLATWSIKSIEPLNELVEKFVATDREELPTILEQEFVICFAGAQPEDQFYSSNYGPSSLDLATKFSAASVREALGLTEDSWQEWKSKTKAYITTTPYGLTRYTAKIFNDHLGEQGQIKVIELWAANDENAREMVEQDYACENIVSVSAS